MLPQGTQVRSFAAQKAEGALQKPDIPIHGIHGRYALALFEAGNKQGHLDQIDNDLKQARILLSQKGAGNLFHSDILRGKKS